MPNSTPTPLEKQTFRKLKRLYIFALSAIAISLLLSQLLVHRFLNEQKNDSTIVNISGRQRMLSQQLTKEALELQTSTNQNEREQLAKDIEATVKLWSQFHNALKNGDPKIGLKEKKSAELNELIDKIDPHFHKMETAAHRLVRQIHSNAETGMRTLQPGIAQILENESLFLNGMDQFVNQYEKESVQRVRRSKKLEIFLSAFTILILLFELMYFLLPAAKAVRNTISDLVFSKEQAKQMAFHADKLSLEKDKSVKELKVLNQAINQKLFFARVLPDGEIIELGEKFSRVFNHRGNKFYNKIQNLISIEDGERILFEQLLQQNSRSNWQGEVKGTTTEGKNVWMEMSLIPYNLGENHWELLLIAIDISSRKEAQLEIVRLTQEQFDDKMNRQKFISSKIIENQEQEQNRIAKDIHDGIGQMLTALSLNLESINTENKTQTAQKVQNLKELTQNIIKGVRTATFNLMPPELSDHGIVPALNKLTEELAKLTGKRIFLYDKTGFDQRLDSLVEINIYRLTQEAINNAIKYANSTQIVVTVSHSKNLLSINVDDNGKGFNIDNLKSNSNGEGGMGLAYMKERVQYIDGRFFIHSEPGKGTRVTINIPISFE